MSNYELRECPFCGCKAVIEDISTEDEREEKKMKVLKYKGITFDDYEQNEDGTYWAEICQECVEKHYDLISDVIDDGGTARGCCSVKGCYNDGDDENKMHYYIDFKSEFVSFEEVGENEDYDQQYI